MDDAKIVVRTKPNCKFCLGSGMAAELYGPGEHVCPCVTEQLTIMTVEKDYSIPAGQRHVPGKPEFVKEWVNP